MPDKPPLRRLRRRAQRSATLVAACVVACGLWGAQALAQVDPLNGIKAGEARVHPWFDLEMGYDSAAGAFPVLSPEYLVHFKPGLRMELPLVMFDARLDANMDYVWYTGILAPGSQILSRLQANSNLNVSINRQGTYELQLSNYFSRSDRTKNPAFGLGVLSIYNELKLAAPIHPPGEAIELKPELSWETEMFEPFFSGCEGDAACDPQIVRGANYHNVRLGTSGRYRILPKTAVLGSIDFVTRRFQDRATNPDAYVLRLDAGIAGAITPRVSILAKVGWGQGFSAVVTGSITAHFELMFMVNDFTRLKAGYLRRVEPVAGSGLFRNDRFYTDGSLLLWGRLTLNMTVALDYLAFLDAAARNDRIFSLSLGPTYPVTRWLELGFTYGVSSRTTDLINSRSLNFTRHEGLLRVSFSY